MALTSLKNVVQVFGKISLNLDLSDVFLWWDWNYVFFFFFWKNATEVTCPFHHVREYLLSTWLTKGDISLDHLVNIMSARFLQCKSNIFLPFLYSNPYQWVTKSNLPWRGRKLNSTVWQEDIYVYYLDFFCKDLSVFTCLCIYLASQLVQW